MRTTILRSACALAALTATLTAASLTPSALASSAGTTDAAIGSDSLTTARSLLESGRVVEARELLLSIRTAETQEQVRSDALLLLGQADAQLRSMTRAAVSLQKAEFAFANDDLREAERQANAVMRSRDVSMKERGPASDLLDAIALRRHELSSGMDGMLFQAHRDFENGNYGAAKAGVEAIDRIGMRLSQDDQRTLNRLKMQIADMERQNGPLQADEASLGVVSPAAPAAAATFASLASSAQDGNDNDLVRQATRDAALQALSSADSAFEDGRYAEAARAYAAILSSTSYVNVLTDQELDRIESRSREANQLIGAAQPGGLDDVEATRRIIRGQIETEVSNLLEIANAAIEQGDFERANINIAEARLRWQSGYNNGYFGEAEYRERLGEIEAASRSLDVAEEQTRLREIAEQERDLTERVAAQEDRAASERAARVSESLDRLRALQAEKKYQEALEVVEEILFIDPNNPTALLMRDVLRDILIFREYNRLQREQGLSYSDEWLRIEEGKIIPDSILDYPDDWPAISVRRGMRDAYVDSEVDRRVLTTLNTRRVPARFNNDSAESVFSFLATVTNLNFDVDWDSLSAIGVDRDTPVDLELNEVPARVILDRVLEKISPDDFDRAGWAVQDGIVVIASDRYLRRRTFIVIYDIRDLIFEIPDYGDVPTLNIDDVLDQGGQGGGGGGGGIFDDPQDEDGDPGAQETENLENLLEIIQTAVDFDGWRDNGGDTGIVQELNGNLIITNTSRNHRDINTLLRQLREVRNIQISVETRFLTVTEDFFEKIGFDFDVYFNTQNNQRRGQQFGLDQGVPTSFVNPTSATNPETGRPVFSSQAPGFFQDPTDGSFAFVPGANLVQGAPTLGSFTQVPALNNSNDIATNILSGSEFASNILGLSPALSVAGTFFDDVQVDFLVEATQADRRGVVLTTPRLTFTNGKTANVFVNTQRAFISDLQPVVGTSSVAFDPTLSTASEGFTLLIRGVVSADRRYVTLDVQASTAVIEEIAGVQITAQVGGGEGGGDLQQSGNEIQLPIVQVTRVQTGVTVPDKGTILLGGQRISTETESEVGVPVLSSIPFVNRFFTNRVTDKSELTLLILIKPTIILQGEEEEMAFPGLNEQLRQNFNY
jgi:type II secretory pathway component GspD/PulD (secretin)/tetratricopeptide (TPR) repeat protein